MKCTIPEISWHNREPVLSVDIHPIKEKFYRLASGGADCHVLIWQLNICDNGAVKIEALSELTRHQRAVNSVRWSPEGQYLATADDDANIIIWQLKTDNIPLLDGESNDKDKEIWIIHKVMRGHKEDIYDLCWSPDSQKLLSGSIDNTAILWDFAKGKSENILTDHKGFVQGVTWDPKNQYIATISTDRICRIFESSAKQVKTRIQKGILPVPKDHYLYNKEIKFFHDDTFKSFFRRLDFSPDGTLLVVPSGRVEVEDCKEILNATYIFAVDSWTEPIAIFPSGKQCSTVVRFCPMLFELHEDGPDSVISLPYRMILAIGTDHDIILYDTQQTTPFAYFKDIHYTRLTDLTWSKDGRLLVASSTDGFCALITFELDELGVPYVKEESEVEDNIMNISGCEEIVDKDETLDVLKEKIDTTKPKKPNLLEQWTIKTPKKLQKCTDESVVKNKSKTENETNKRKLDNDSPKTHKRIKPIPVPVDKVKDENVCVQKDNVDIKLNQVKRQDAVNPLTNFLKRGMKNKRDEDQREITTSSSQTIDLTLDEIEARDAFPSDKSEKLFIDNKNVMEMDDYTEEFSLHLEDTNTADNTNSNFKNGDISAEDRIKPVVSEDNRENTNKICIESKSESINVGNEMNIKDTEGEQIKEALSKDNGENTNKICISDVKTANVENEMVNKKDVKEEIISKHCVQNRHKVEDCLESEKSSNKLQLENSTENKTITKRRIPLITLSSPKHKKK